MAENMFSEFDPVSAKAWKQKIQYQLQGADYNDTLVWESPEGIKVKPFYHEDDLENNAPFSINITPWNIGQNIYAGNTKLANKNAVKALKNGVESIVFTIPNTSVKIEEILANIDVKKTPLYFNFQFLSEDYIRQIISFLIKSEATYHLQIDPIGNLARTGNWYQNLNSDLNSLKKISHKTLALAQNSILSIDVGLYQNAGANIVQQLAYAMAHANEYANLGLIKNEEQITFKVAIGSNYFFEIAKLKALRVLWRTLANEYKINTTCNIIASPTKRTKTVYDYNVNMLRSTSECMSAILGGANTIVNVSYDHVYHKDNAFGARIARNQLLVLKNEAHFNKVSNPTDGAYYIEELTHQLAEKALALFKNIEQGGGFLKQLKEQTIQKKIKESAQKEQTLFDQNKLILVGTNTFKNSKETMKNSIELYPFVKMNNQKTLIEPIIEKRLAEALEQKRLNDE